MFLLIYISLNLYSLYGHCGSIVAKYSSKHLHKYVIQRPEYPNDIPEALRQARTKKN